MRPRGKCAPGENFLEDESSLKIPKNNIFNLIPLSPTRDSDQRQMAPSISIGGEFGRMGLPLFHENRTFSMSPEPKTPLPGAKIGVKKRKQCVRFKKWFQKLKLI